MSERRKIHFQSVETQLAAMRYWMGKNEARADAGIITTDQRGTSAHVDPTFDDDGSALPVEILDAIHTNRDDSQTRW